jgi:tRNA threonylcarbamoyladenosine biosynthesis protein TsaB
MELAIDTATEVASIALSSAGRVEAEMSWPAGQNHTVELIPNILYLLRQAKVEPDGGGRSTWGSKIDAVIVAKGPGSFNGLRVGFATAKGFAFSMDIPLVSVGTLEIEAFPHAQTGLPICPIQDAGRGEIATALYEVEDGEWHQLIEEHITTVEELCEGISSKTVFCGRFSERSHDFAHRIEELMEEKAVILENTFCRAGFLAELGYRRLERGERDDVATVQPLYLRRPSITKPKRGNR